MGVHEYKTKEELLSLVENLEKEVDKLSSELALSKKKRFREVYSTRILDALPDMLTAFDHDACIVELVSSPNTNHVEGASDIVGSNVKDIISKEAYESVRYNMDQVIKTGLPSVGRHELQLNNDWHYYENRIFPLDDKYLLCMCRDISERVRIEEENTRQQAEITRLNSLMDAIVNNVPVYLFVKDTGNDFRYLFWNQAFAEYLGIPREEALGRNDVDLFKDKEGIQKIRQDDQLVMKAGHLEYVEEYIERDGKKHYAKTAKTLVPSGNGSPYIIGIVWDVTDVKDGEQKLIEARNKAEEADKLKSAFLANMSHEIRTPLNAIVGFTKLIADSSRESEQHQYAEIVEKNSKLLLTLFNDIIDLAALESGALQLTARRFNLHDVCLQLLGVYSSAVQPGVKLILDPTDVDVPIMGDWDRVSQIWTNLLSNAIKFTPTGEIHLGFTPQENSLQCYVRDTGIGIPAERAATIFERFGKVNNFVQGSGLGLTLCRMLVEKMGGRIWVQSIEGEGTTFYFTLPLCCSV